MKAKLTIYGKGQHANVVKSIFDTSITINMVNDSDFVLDDSDYWHIGIGNNFDRKKIAEKLSYDLDFPVIKAESATISCDYDSLGEGTVFMAGSTLQINSKIGKHCIINTNASIDHDCVIGDYVHIAPGSILCGNVTVGDCTIIGAGSVIIPGIKIGKNCIIGAGSVVVKNIPDNTKAFGNPCIYKEAL